MRSESVPRKNTELPKSNLTGSADNLPEFYSFGSFDLYSDYTGYAKRYHFALWLPLITLIVLFVIVNL